MRLPLNVRRSLVSLSLALGSVMLVSACSEPAPPPPPPAPAVKTPQERAQLYQDCWSQFNNKDWDKFQNCFDANAVSETIDSSSPSLTGRTAIVERAKLETSSFPDRKGEIRLLLVNGAQLVSIAQYAGTNTAPLPPGPDGKAGPTTNKPFGFLMGHVIDLDANGNAATHEAAYIDEGTFARQVGLAPGPVRPVEKATGAAPVIVYSKSDDSERANVATVQATFDAFNKRDLKAYEALLGENYRGIEAESAGAKNKKEAMAATREMIGGFADVKITPSKMWGAGDYVVIFGTFEGTNTGDMPSMGMKKTGKKVVGRFCEIIKVEGGKVADDYLFYNGGAFMAQLTAK